MFPPWHHGCILFMPKADGGLTCKCANRMPLLSHQEPFAASGRLRMSLLPVIVNALVPSKVATQLQLACNVREPIRKWENT
jgi:hypothetical protein